MKKFIISVLFVVAVVAPLNNAQAQRTAYKQVFLSGNFGTTFTSVGAECFVGSYQLDGFWSFGTSVMNRCRRETNTGGIVSFLRTEFPFTYTYRVYNTTNRSLNIYIGGDAFLGFEVMDPFHQLSDEVRSAVANSGYRRSSFLYGLSPRGEVEFFPVDFPAAIVAAVRAPVTFGTSLETFGVEVLVGLRYGF